MLGILDLSRILGTKINSGPDFESHAPQMVGPCFLDSEEAWDVGMMELGRDGTPRWSSMTLIRISG
jgi:hypothetical protein